ncbi:putative Flavonoid 3-hydroxylase [Heracleum sosnowskyi]|uniref:Flavonoid 3-hydroxylase n=1 Tax=Heracleum sosnowskyi TaxID=360622 RepID=A0AAD8I3Y3_9APIA|nr:putative Flavonoid 3-hydroxylase [Heracleum sosnowskyi]
MSTSVYIIILPLMGALWWFFHLRSKERRSKLPPGPAGLPIIGNLHMLGELPHRDITKLSQIYGPIMYLRLGSVPTIVISSPPLIEQVLKTHDTVFASRPKTQASKFLSYDNKAIVFKEYGPYWRSVKKFCTSQLLSTTKIESTSWQRKEELGLMVESLRGAAAAREVVNVSEKLARLIEDMTCRMLFGKSRDERFDMSKVIPELACLNGLFNVADYLPILGPLDLQGLGRRFKVAFKTIDNILETIINDHEEDARNSNVKLNRDFVDVLLSLQNDTFPGFEQLSKSIDQSNVKALILDMLMGALDTSHNSIDWILSELVRNPRVMKILQAEIESVLVHNFNWELPDGSSHAEMDMSETFGLTMPRAKHLCATPCVRLP